jgi:L-ascorbate metabolism protein UlaG (beta-lactamase superfamily)
MPMIVNYFGDGCFRLQSGETTLMINPGNNRLKADAVLRTLVAPNAVPPADEIVFPGEYEVKSIEIQGWPVPEESTDKYLKTVYLVTWEEMRIVFLGHISAIPGDEIIENISEPDVLFIPTGDHFLSGTDAAKLVKKLAPAIVIPSFAKNPNEFLKALGQKGEMLEKLVFKKKELENAKGRIVVLEAKN